MPSASFQCSRLIWSGISEPVAKLPGRSEIDTIASSGKMVIAISDDQDRVRGEHAPALAPAGDDGHG